MAQMARRRAWRLSRRFGLRRGGAVIAACVAVIVALAVAGITRGMTMTRGFTVERLAAQDEGDATGEVIADGGEPEEEPQRVVVHVDGAVASPGVYELVDDSPRVADAVEAAGGLTDEADTTSVNLAATLLDGQKVHIPMEGEQEPAGGAVSVSTAEGLASVVNINSATAEELQSLPGVGEATARAIIEERERGGPFASVEDIMRVSGIGEKKFARIQGLICV